jgi:ferredoxin
MKRKIITIDEGLCDGCGSCVSACSEGALQIVDGKARLVREDFCDGFGDCIGECPTGAMVIEERESTPFDIGAVKGYLLKTQGEAAVRRMEESQKKHGAEKNQTLPCGCPGSLSQVLAIPDTVSTQGDQMQAKLGNWPVQIHLLPLKAPYYKGADLLVAADCCAYAYAGFHSDFIEGRTLAIGCPKLDNAGAYKEKLAAILGENDIKSVTIAYMEVPCCEGLAKLVGEAVKGSGKSFPIKKKKIGIKGKVIA